MFQSTTVLSRFLLQVTIIITLSKVISIAIRKLNQPTVISDLLTRILLGPSILLNLRQILFPPDSAVYLNVLGELGLILLMYLVGLEVQVKKMEYRNSLIVCFGGIITPFSLSYTISMYSKNDSILFYVFIGMTNSITAFPILARVVRETGLLKTNCGVLSLSSAYVVDFLAWVSMVIMSTIVKNPENLWKAAVTLVCLLVFAYLTVAVVSVLLDKMVRNSDQDCSRGNVIVILGLLFINCVVTSAIGSDFIFGAFLTGIITPRSRGFAIEIAKKLEDLVYFFFVPLYFASGSSSLVLNDLQSSQTWILILICFVVCTVGKVVGSGLAAKFCGLSWRESLAVGVLTNTRGKTRLKGLIEYIFLQFGKNNNIINDQMYTALAITSIITTFSTVPLLSIIYPKHLRRYYDSVEAAIPENPSNSKILICVDDYSNVNMLSYLLGILFKNSIDVDLWTLRLFKMQGNSSNIMQHSDLKSTFSHDTRMSFVQAFGSLHQINIRSLLSVSYTGEFCDNILDACVDMKMQLCIVMARKQKEYPKYIESLIEMITIPLMVFMNNGYNGGTLEDCFDPSSLECNVVVIFSGDFDDMAMLPFVAKFFTGECLVTLLAATGYNKEMEDALSNTSISIEYLLPINEDYEQRTNMLQLADPPKLKQLLMTRLRELNKQDICVLGQQTLESCMSMILPLEALCSYLVFKSPSSSQ